MLLLLWQPTKVKLGLQVGVEIDKNIICTAQDMILFAILRTPNFVFTQTYLSDASIVTGVLVLSGYNIVG